MKEDKIVVFPIIITKDDEEKIPYLVYVPDLDSYTQGRTFIEAILMGEDLIASQSLVRELPPSNTKMPKAKENETVTLVTVNISRYKRIWDNQVVKKTLTIPKRLNDLGVEQGIDFSALLTEALERKLYGD